MEIFTKHIFGRLTSGNILYTTSMLKLLRFLLLKTFNGFKIKIDCFKFEKNIITVSLKFLIVSKDLF